MATFRRFLRYMTTQEGKELTMYTMAVAGMGGFCVTFAPHFFLINRYRELVASYKDGTARPLSEVLKNRFQKAIELVNLKDYEEISVRPFVTRGLDTFHAGSFKTSLGAIIGLPRNYNWDEFSESDVLVAGKPVDWKSEEGKALKASLNLTEKEQIFAIAREMLHCNSYYRYLDAGITPIGVLITYTFAHVLNLRMDNFTKPRLFRFMLYGAVCGFFFTLMLTAKDVFTHHFEARTDEKLAELGEEWIKVGVSFYEKLVAKDEALKKITKNEKFTTELGFYTELFKKAIYGRSADGVERIQSSRFDVGGFRVPHIPATDRKAYFEKKLKALMSEINADCAIS